MLSPTPYTLINSLGTSVVILDFGLTITSFNISVKGKYRNVVLGFNDPNFYMNEAYRSKNPYLGNVVGRYANRIKGGSFTLNGIEYSLPRNNSENTLHGGINGFNRKWWTYIPELSNAQKAVFTYTSQDGEEGFPGQLDITATYFLDNENALNIEYKTYAHADSVVNLTEHSYFNLNGSNSLINDHILQANVKSFLAQGADLCPDGIIIEASKFSEDIRNPARLGHFLPDGVDTTFILDKLDAAFTHAATLESGDSLVSLQVWTDAPCLHIYTGAMLPILDEPEGISLQPFRGVCLECQGYTDAVNHPHFKSTNIQATETQYRNIRYQPLIRV